MAAQLRSDLFHIRFHLPTLNFLDLLFSQFSLHTEQFSNLFAQLIFIRERLILFQVVFPLDFHHLVQVDMFARLIRDEAHRQTDRRHRHHEHASCNVIEVDFFIPITVPEHEVALVDGPGSHCDLSEQAEQRFELFRVFFFFDPGYVAVADQKHVDHAGDHVGTADLHCGYDASETAVLGAKVSDFRGLFYALLEKPIFESQNFYQIVWIVQ